MSSVSIVIPCYNYAHFLRECVESVLSQGGVEVRVLVIDDTSPDNTPEIAAELTSKDPRVEYRRHQKNAGHIATYNEGLAWASGDYTVLLSADDFLTPGALLRATDLMDAHPEVGFVYGGCVTVYTGQPVPQARLPTASHAWQIYTGLNFIESLCKTGYCFISSPEVVVRTGLQHKLGGYRPDLPHTGDMEMWMRFAAHGAVGQILDADQAYYRVHSRNMHNSYYSAAAKEVQQRRAAFDIVFQEYKDLIPGWERLQKLADRSLAGDALWAVCQAYFRREVAQTPVHELIEYVNDSYRGEYLSVEYIRVYSNLINRILQSARRKFASAFQLSHRPAAQ